MYKSRAIEIRPVVENKRKNTLRKNYTKTNALDTKSWMSLYCQSRLIIFHWPCKRDKFDPQTQREKKNAQSRDRSRDLPRISQTAFISPGFIRAGLCIRVCRWSERFVWLKAMIVGGSATNVRKNFDAGKIFCADRNRGKNAVAFEHAKSQIFLPRFSAIP